MSQIDTDRFRTILLDERQRVVDAISYLHEETPGSLEEETEEIIGSSDNHPAETASATLDREIDYTLEENSEHVLAEIDGALARIEEGTYGTCRTCGQPIAEERLEAIPYATQCIDCKRREERG
ncbi:MAG: TraR/DksA C4-type zinc finger protein [Actinomycetota bacterium]|nr:TraR/DksA C4-type zinc finger protein [Actinomycetota bacterium]